MTAIAATAARSGPAFRRIAVRLPETIALPDNPPATDNRAKALRFGFRFANPASEFYV